MAFKIRKAHKDWYHDELAFDTLDSGYGEDLFRLDFCVGHNEFQAQLFLTTTLKEKKFKELEKKYKYRVPSKHIAYRSARLFIERDNRIPRHEGGDGERWDYAFDSWKLKPAEAVALLREDEKVAMKLMKKYIDRIVAMPNNRQWLADEYGPPVSGKLTNWEDGHGKRGWEKILLKWSYVDAVEVLKVQSKREKA